MLEKDRTPVMGQKEISDIVQKWREKRRLEPFIYISGSPHTDRESVEGTKGVRSRPCVCCMEQGRDYAYDVVRALPSLQLMHRSIVCRQPLRL